jgi:hypothetical protein
MTRPRLVYVGHSHHLKTGSVEFLTSLLAAHFEFVRVADESWQAGRPALTAGRINAEQPDIVVFFQLILAPRELRRLQCRNIVWIPMHDNVRYRSSRYRRYAASGLKSLHFSAATETFFSRLGYETLRVQYFPPAGAVRMPPAEPQLFFWVRRKELSWPLLKTLLGDFRPARIVLRHEPDPGYEPPELPSPADVAEYKIDVHRGWMERASYAQLVAACQLFMAPRLLEGIGQAMLEAMAHGLAIIAPDAPTMNEYVRDGQNGYLYDPQRPSPLRFDRWRELARRAQADVDAGHRQWLASEAAVLDYVRRPPARVETFSWRLRRRLGI